MGVSQGVAVVSRCAAAVCQLRLLMAHYGFTAAHMLAKARELL